MIVLSIRRGTFRLNEALTLIYFDHHASKNNITKTEVRKRLFKGNFLHKDIPDKIVFDKESYLEKRSETYRKSTLTSKEVTKIFNSLKKDEFISYGSPVVIKDKSFDGYRITIKGKKEVEKLKDVFRWLRPPI